MLAATRARLNYDEHRELALRLCVIRAELREMVIELPQRYTRRAECVKAVDAALLAVDELRCRLDDRFRRDFPQTHDVNVYFPRRT